MAFIFKYLNITLLEIIKKFLKIYNFNLLLIKINFVNIKFNNNSDLEKRDIILVYFSRSFRRSSRHMLGEEVYGSSRYYRSDERSSYAND